MKAAVPIEINLIKSVARNKKISIDILLKGVAVEVFYRWFANEIKIPYLSWDDLINEVERNFNDKDTIVINNYICSVFHNNYEAILYIECDQFQQEMLDGVSAFIKEILLEWGNFSGNSTIIHKIPSKQKAMREKRNRTQKVFSNECLHKAFFEKVKQMPEKVALVYYKEGNKEHITYSCLQEMVLKLVGYLRESGIKEGTLVGVSIPKGINQIVAVLGILAVGATYVPIGVHQPIERKKKIIDTGEIRFILTSNEMEFEGNLGVSVLYLEDGLQAALPVKEVIFPKTNQPAYIIFTSGTTGVPKGVVVSHNEAHNTITDINERFNVGKDSIGIAISELDFDLSVYDIFGLLSVGGTLVTLSEETKREPVFWKKAIIEAGVNVWNSVPALFDMLLTTCESDGQMLPFKLVLLSGDWINMELYGRLRALSEGCKFVSLGGATEAAIWSNFYVVDSINSEWKSIPYGEPLSNQYLKVVDYNGYDCPDYVNGELWIGGDSVAEGYLNAPELTEKKFIVEDGIRWYKTGDLVRYNSAGIVEFLGRIDNQVKINGYRIELGEIENVAKGSPDVFNVVVGVIEENEKKELGGVIIPKISTSNNVNIICYRNDDNYSDFYIKERESVVRPLIAEFCNKEFGISVKYKPLIQFWKNWLDSHIEKSADILVAREENELLKKVVIAKGIFLEILAGERQAEELLQREETSPEFWSLNGEDTKYFLDKFLPDKVHDKKIAVLGARTGEIIKQYWNLFDQAEEITLFDNSAGILKLAQEKLAKIETNVHYCSSYNNGIEESEVNKYDIVLAVNYLHINEDPLNEVKWAALLLKEEGEFYAIEYEKFDPMGILISGLLENGFVNRKKGRGVCTPLLSLDEWKEIYKQSPFEKVVIERRGKLGALLISAKNITSGIRQINFNISKYMNKNLPEYMIPTKRMFAKQVILNRNGKVDREQTLKLLDIKQTEEMESIALQGIEAEIAELWINILNCKIFDRNQSFFESGGDSLSATRFLAEIKKKYSVDIPLKDIFNAPSLNSIANLLQSKIAEGEDMIEGEI